ncbi:MAG: HD domain-containing phosphohydrolase [Planctomycetota bacterium]
MSRQTQQLHPTGTRRFKPTHQTRLTAVARTAPLKERVEALEEEASKLALLLEMSRSLSSDLELDEVMGLIVDHASRIMGCDRSSVLLLDKDKHELYALIAQGLDTQELRFSAGSGIAGYVIREGLGVNVPDAYKDEHFNQNIDKATGYRTVSVLCLPLQDRRGETLGVIECLNKKGPEDRPVPFTTKDEVVLGAVASQAAVYLVNSALRRRMDLLFESFVEAISRAIDDRDPCTSGHSRRVTQLSMNLAFAVHNCKVPPFEQITYTRARMRQLRYAGLLHDVGKIGVREHILSKAGRLSPPEMEAIRQRFVALQEKSRADCLARALAEHLPAAQVLDQGHARLCADLTAAQAVIERTCTTSFLPDNDLQVIEAAGARGWINPAEQHHLSVRKGNLTPEEWEDMKSHVTKSYRMLIQIPWPPELKDVPEVAYSHHERNDGSGYPRSLRSDAIHFDGRIMAIADMYDALVATDRPYKKSIPHDKARQILMDEAAHGRLPVELVQIFFSAECYKLPEQGAQAGSSFVLPAAGSGMLPATRVLK